MKTLLHNAIIVNEGMRFPGYIVIADDKIARVGINRPSLNEIDPDIDMTIDCRGDMLLPGVIDSHVHFRDPGLTNKGSVATESRAAVAGGVTSYIDMPNTKPATTTIEAWEAKMEHAKRESMANYAFFIGATNDNLEVLLTADYSRVPGIKLFMGSSTGNMLVDNEEMLNRLFDKSPVLIMVHAEDETTINNARDALLEQYGDAEVPVTLHSTLRPSQACVTATRRAIDLAQRYGTRLHLAHISTADELKLLHEGNVADKQITAETCPHYLLFNQDDLQTHGARLKCNPAIKSENDRRMLLEALKNHVIDSVSTDHAPHLPKEKEGDLFNAASGMPGVQFSLALMLSIPGVSPELVANVMCHNQARIFGIEGRGFLRAGYQADIVRVAQLEQPREITDADVMSLCGWTPFKGCKTTCEVVTTWVNGKIAYDHGQVANKSNAQSLNFNQTPSFKRY